MNQGEPLDLALFESGETSYEESAELFKQLSVKAADEGAVPKRRAEGEIFDRGFHGGLIDHPDYRHCTFNETVFNGPNASYSQFENCSFVDCSFRNGDFRYSNWLRSQIIGTQPGKSRFDKGNFAYSSIKSTKLSNTSIAGVTFRQALMQDCTLDDVVFEHVVFEHVDFRGTTFKNLDLRYAGVRYCNFTGAKLENVTFPILDICNNYGIIDVLSEHSESVRLSTGVDTDVSLGEALSLLPKLIPYYRETGLYFCLLNLLDIFDQDELLMQLLPEALKRTIEEDDFESLLNVCELLVATKRFTSNELKEINSLIDSLIDPDSLPYHLRMSYLTYMDRIREVLVENPDQLPSARLLFYTNVPPDNPDGLAPLITEIINTCAQVAPSANLKVSLSHHSDFMITGDLVGTLAVLHLACQTFYYLFGGVKALKDISASTHESTDGQGSSAARNSKMRESEKSTSIELGGFKFEHKSSNINSVRRYEYYIEEHQSKR